MWIGARRELGDLRDFRAATLTAAVTKARETAEEFYSRNATGPAAELLLWIFGRRMPLFNKGPQLVVTGEPGQFTATGCARRLGATARPLRTCSRLPG
jgi:hypothetical protein